MAGDTEGYQRYEIISYMRSKVGHLEDKLDHDFLLEWHEVLYCWLWAFASMDLRPRARARSVERGIGQPYRVPSIARLFKGQLLWTSVNSSMLLAASLSVIAQTDIKTAETQLSCRRADGDSAP